MNKVAYTRNIVVVLFVVVCVIVSLVLSHRQDGDICAVSAILIPHYNGAKEARSALIKDASARCQPKTVIVLSPNHYKTGGGNIITTDQDMDFAGNDARVNKQLSRYLDERGVATINDNAFLNEHGIKNVLPELARYFPKSDFLPIIINEEKKRPGVDGLYGAIVDNCPDCLVVASVDFSHSVPISTARENDSTSLSVLQNKDIGKVWKVTADSRQSLYFITKWAQAKNHHFTLINNSNSGLDTNTPSEYLVSYILGYYAR